MGLQGYVKYSCSKLREFNVDCLPAVPDESWAKKDVLISRSSMGRAFEELKKEIGEKANSAGIISFSPKDWIEQVYVYFNPDDLNSLHIVVSDRKTGDDYAERINIEKPYNVSKHDRMSERFWLR